MSTEIYAKELTFANLGDTVTIPSKALLPTSNKTETGKLTELSMAEGRVSVRLGPGGVFRILLPEDAITILTPITVTLFKHEIKELVEFIQEDQASTFAQLDEKIGTSVIGKLINAVENSELEW